MDDMRRSCEFRHAPCQVIGKRLAHLALTVIALSMLSIPATAAVVSVGASQDTTIYSESGTTSNGAGQYLFTGETNDGFLRRALVRFNVADAVPTGSTVSSVTLVLYLSRTRTQNQMVTLHRVLAAWGEGTSHAAGEEGQGATAAPGDATWTYRFYPSLSWTTAGGDFVSGASAGIAVGNQNGDYAWSSAGMVADVQSWLAGTPNYGWILIGNESQNKVTKRFDTHENSDVSRRPELTIEYAPPATTSSTSTTSATSTTSTSSSTTSSTSTSSSSSLTTFTTEPAATTSTSTSSTTSTSTSTTSSSSTTTTSTSTSTSSTSTTATSSSTTTLPLVLTPFVDPLPRPAVAQPTSGSPGGTATYTLAIRQVQQQLHRDLPATMVWGFGDGAGGATYPGPTIEAARDQPVTVTWVDDLRDGGVLRTTHYLPVDTCLHGADDASPRTVVHLHGGHVPAASDGYPEATILPGEQATYQYPNTQLPATLWYHDHALGITRLNVYMGLAGFYLLRDAVEAGLGLPAGEFEVPLVVQDRSFNADGSLQYPAAWQDHFFGDTILVNGKVWPYLEVKQGKYRFRLLNGSTSRAYTLALSSGASFSVIGTEGGLLPAPVAVSTVTLTPGERVDVVVDFASYAAGTEILLTNSAPAPYPGTPGEGVVPDVMKFVVLPDVGHTAVLPTTLRPLEALAEGDAVESRTFELRRFAEPCTGQAWYINGLGWDDLTEFPQLGTTEIWSFINRSGITHPMHMHLVMFQVLDQQAFEIQNGVVVPIGPRVPPPPESAGWKDTVPVPPDQIVRVIARFEDYKGKYPYHCHILEHEDHEMMRQFETVSCGDGEVDPGEQCGETGLGPCQSGLLCAGCVCRARGDCSVDGTAVDLFDVLAQIDLVLGRFTPRPVQTLLCDDDCDGDIDLFDVLTGIDVVLGRRSLPLVCPSSDTGSVGKRPLLARRTRG